MISLTRRNLETLVILLGGAALLTLGLDQYVIQVVTLTAIFALAGIGLNILVGFTGIVSVGHAAFVLIGAYSWAILTQGGATLGRQVLAVVLAVALGASTAWGLGYVCLRFRGYHLAIATLAFGLGMWAIARHWVGVTRGNAGITGVPRASIPLLPPSLTALALTLVLFALFWWLQVALRASKPGAAMLATRGDEQASMVIGISVRTTRVLAFVFSAVPATVAGVLLAQQTRFVHPDQFAVIMSVQLIAIPIIGGRGWRWAPLAGALFVIALPEYTRFLTDYRLVVYGLSLMLVVLFLPGGLRDITAMIWKIVGRATGNRVRVRQAV